MQLQVLLVTAARQPKRFFASPDSMLSVSLLPSDDFAKQLIHSGVHSLLRFGVIRISPPIIFTVDVPSAACPEAGHLENRNLLGFGQQTGPNHDSSSLNGLHPDLTC